MDCLIDEVICYILEFKEKLFFVYLFYYMVYLFLQVKVEKIVKYWRKLSWVVFVDLFFVKKGEMYYKFVQDILVYVVMVESLDENIGCLLDILYWLGFDECIIVVFMFDNGGMVISNIICNILIFNLFLCVGKGYLYEGGIKVFVIIWWSGYLKGRQVLDILIIGMDYYLILFDFCGLFLLFG